MRKIIQPPAHLAYACLNPALNLWRQTEENGVKLAGVDFRGLAHGASGLANPHTALAQVGLAALNAGYELWIQFSLVLEVICQPILKLHRLFGRQLPHLSFDGFELAHGNSVPRRIWNFKAGLRKQGIRSLSPLNCLGGSHR